jgi:hypothetical protein
MLRLRPALTAAALLALAPPAAAQGRNAQDILREVAARAETRMRGVQNYTLNTKVMGISLVSYLSRGEDGEFHVQSAGTGPFGSAAAEMAGWADELLLMMGDGLSSGATPEEMEVLTYEGVVNSGGAPAHRISMDLTHDSAAALDEDMPRRFSVDFDTVTLVIRRMEAEMQAAAGGTPAVMVAELGDWRPVGTMLLPFHRHLVLRGIRAEVLGEDVAEAEQILVQGRASIAQVPEAQREPLRQMLEMIQGLLKRDEMVLDEVVTSVAVNQGPPAALASAAGRTKND